MKRFLSLLLALLLCAGLLSLPRTAVKAAPGEEAAGQEAELSLFSPEDPEEASVTLSIEDGRLKAAYTGTSAGTALLIAVTYDGEGRMKKAIPLTCKSGESVSFPHDNTAVCRVYAVHPDTCRPLCEPVSEIDAFSGTVDVPYLAGPAATALSMAVRRSAEARRLLDGLLELDPAQVCRDKEKLDAALAQVNAAIAAYEDLMQSSAVLYYTAEQSAAELQEDAAAIAARLGGTADLQTSQEEQRHWAEELSRKFDSIQGSMKLAALGKMLGCDAREAYEQLTAAQDILRGQYLSEAESATRWIKGLTAVKTGAKVALLVGGIAVTGGATTLAGAPAAIAGAELTGMQTVGLLVGFTDTVIDVGKTGATMVFGDDHGLVKHLEDKSKPFGYISYTFSLLTLNTASAPEIVAFLGDTYQNLKDAAPGTVNKVENFILNNDSLTMEVKAIINPLGAIGKLISDLVENPGDTVTGADTERLDLLRPEITDMLIAQTLKDAKVLEEEQTLEDFGEKQEEFEKEAAQELAEKKSEEEGAPKLTFHEDRSGWNNIRRDCYYQDESGNYVGIRECFYDGMLVDRYCYGEDGALRWRDSWHYPDGRLSHHEEYTGWELGDIYTDFQYDYERDGEHLKLIRQFVCAPYTTSSGELTTTWDPYYGVCLRYVSNDEENFLAEASTGNGGVWANTEVYDREGRLSSRTELDAAGNVVVTSYFTEQPAWWEWFDPSTHAAMKQTYTPFYYEDSADTQPLPDEELIREEWKLGSWEEDITDEEGNKIGYTKHYGYLHYTNTLVDTANAAHIDVTEPVEYYYD